MNFGFEAIGRSDAPEATVYKHIKSGATFLHIQSNDNNKVFFLSFRTPALGHTGAAHIVEHCVLCGSKKYPLKEPFNELEKGSLHTYLNAMTFADKTVYPIASTNEQDFFNLADVYLDGVFNPLIGERRAIFLQEGWRGIVYNEMKGAYSSPERILNHMLYETLYKDTSYAFSSAGMPEHIPTLSYEAFLKYYEDYYHPSNCLIYMYGDGDVNKMLKLLDAGYLKNYEKKVYPAMFDKNPQFCNRKAVRKDISGGSSYIARGYCLEKDYRLIIGFQILSYMLTGMENSPIKKAVLESGRGSMIYSHISSDIAFPLFCITVKDADEGCFKTIDDTLRQLVSDSKNSLTDLLSAAMHKYEFILKEEEYGYKPKGLVIGLDAAVDFTHGRDLLANLDRVANFEKLKDSYTTEYFLGLINKYLLDDGQQISACEVILNPSERSAADDTPSASNDAALQRELEAFQNSKDDPKDLAAIPLLELSDISRYPQHIIVDTREALTHGEIIASRITKDIAYASLCFDLGSLPSTNTDDEMPYYLGLFCDLLGKVGTKNMPLDKLTAALNSNAGGVSFGTSVFSNETEYYPQMCIRLKALTRNMQESLKLVSELICASDFSDEKRMCDVIRELIAGYNSRILSDGHSFAIGYSLACGSPAHKFSNKVSGMGYYKFLLSLNNSESMSHIANKLDKIRSDILATFITCAFSAPEYYLETGISYLDKFACCITQGKSSRTPVLRAETASLRDTAFITESMVNANALSATAEYNNGYSGELDVLSQIISTEYLWKIVRAQGGAYGCGVHFGRNGLMYLYSMRDPRIAETYEAFKRLPQFINNFSCSNREMRKFIIGAVNSLDRPRGDYAKNEIMLHRHMLGITADDVYKHRQEVLSTTRVNINAFAQMLDECVKHGHICTVGSRAGIETDAGVFEILYTPYKGEAAAKQR